MKTLLKHSLLGIALLGLGSGDIIAQSTGVYCGGHIRREREHTYKDLRNSGFQYAILFNINVMSDGTLQTDNQIVCKDGRYVYGETNPHYVDDVRTLKTAPTSISRLEICIGGWGDDSYDHIKSLVEKQGTGSNSILYRNFKALKDALPFIDAVNNDEEQCYDVSSAVSFHRMMHDLGYKTTLAPYMNKGFWSDLANQLGSGICDRVMVQCYDGGAGNNPSDWHILGNVPLHAGRFHYQNDKISASDCGNAMQSWKDNNGVAGGFIWVYNDNSWPLNEYATRMNRVFGVKTASKTKTTLYADSNYGGFSASLPEGEFTQGELSLYGFQGGDLSSLKVTPGFKVTLYSNADLTGDSKSYTSDCDFVGADWNDKARSVRIEACGKSGLAGNWKIRNRNSGKYLDTDNNSTDNNAAIIQYDDEPEDKSQTWKLIEIGNGVYRIACYNNPGRGFDVNDASTDWGTQVKVYDYVGAPQQQFILFDKGDGYYQIVDRNSGNVVEMPRSTTANGEWVKTWGNNGTNAQQWKLEDNHCAIPATATFYVDDKYRGHAVSLAEGEYNLEQLNFFNIKNDDISSLKVNNGFKVTLYDDDNFSGASKEYTSSADFVGDDFNDKTSSLKIVASGKSGLDGEWKIRNRNSGMYLDVADNKTDNKTPIMQYNDEGSDPSQSWILTDLGNGVYKICASSCPSRGFEVLDASTDNKTQVRLYDYNGGRHQQFVITDAPDGYYHITDRNSGKAVEIPESSTTPGEWLKIYDHNGTETQQWQFARASGVENPEADSEASLAVENRLMTVAGGEGLTLRIHSLTGIEMLSAYIASGFETIDLSAQQPGVYIASAGSSRMKIYIR